MGFLRLPSILHLALLGLMYARREGEEREEEEERRNGGERVGKGRSSTNNNYRGMCCMKLMVLR
jgi:hypothetical protein